MVVATFLCVEASTAGNFPDRDKMGSFGAKWLCSREIVGPTLLSDIAGNFPDRAKMGSFAQIMGPRPVPDIAGNFPDRDKMGSFGAEAIGERGVSTPCLPDGDLSRRAGISAGPGDLRRARAHAKNGFVRRGVNWL
jgi:hypothetical protein